MLRVKLSGIKRNRVVKAGTWYFICNFITNALNFITAPIFTRIIPKAAYGEYNNFISWYGILGCIITINVSTTIVRAKYDFKDEFNSYITSVLLMATTYTSILYIFVWLFKDIFTSFLNMNMLCVTLIFISSLAQIPVAVFQIIQRLEYKYKLNILITLVTSLMTSLLSVILVLKWDDKFMAKVIGSQMPAIVISIGIFLYFLLQWQKPKWKHWKYACIIAFPYIPHMLAGNILSGLDRVMITDIRGAEETATYSVAGNCVAIMAIFSSCINLAIQPWQTEKLHNKSYNQIKKVTNIVFLLFTLMCGYLIILAKEIVIIIGGERYSAAAAIMPPLVIGCLFQFIFGFYVMVEQYEKKTLGMAIATLAAAFTNWGLNKMLIPQYGYQVAAYTTMFSYCLSFVIHYFLLRRLKLHTLFDTRIIVGLTIIISLFSVVVSMLDTFIRYSLIVVMTGTIVYIGCKMLPTVRKE